MDQNQDRILEARAIPGTYKLIITWHNGSTDTVDLEPDIKAKKSMAIFKHKELFAAAEAEDYGWCVEWPGDLSIGSDTLWDLAQKQKTEAA